MPNHEQGQDSIRLGVRLKALKGLQKDYETKRAEAARSGEICLQNGQLPEYLKCKVEESYWRYFRRAVSIRIKQAEKALKQEEDIGAKYGVAIAVTIVICVILIASVIMVNLDLFSIQDAAGFSASHFGKFAAVITVALIVIIVIAGGAIVTTFVAMGRRAGARMGKRHYEQTWGKNDLPDFPRALPQKPAGTESDSQASEEVNSSTDA